MVTGTAVEDAAVTLPANVVAGAAYCAEVDAGAGAAFCGVPPSLTDKAPGLLDAAEVVTAAAIVDSDACAFFSTAGVDAAAAAGDGDEDEDDGLAGSAGTSATATTSTTTLSAASGVAGVASTVDASSALGCASSAEVCAPPLVLITTCGDEPWTTVVDDDVEPAAASAWAGEVDCASDADELEVSNEDVDAADSSGCEVVDSAAESGEDVDADASDCAVCGPAASVSAHATAGTPANAAPIPNAAANAPIRPMRFAAPTAPPE